MTLKQTINELLTFLNFDNHSQVNKYFEARQL